MNTRSFFNKWWLMLIHGLLLIVLSYFLFSNSKQLIETTGTITGFIALLTGCLSFIGYFLAEKNEKNPVEVIAGIFSAAAGLFFLSGTNLAHDFIVWFYAAFIFFNAIILVSVGWQLKEIINWWWLTLLVLLYTFFVLYLFIAGAGNTGISLQVFAAIQFFVTGIFSVVLAFVVKKIQEEYSKPIGNLKNSNV